jgi:phosphoribosylformylglycinamidine synthase subunit PurS
VRFRASVQVTLKPSVLDPQGVAVLHALGALGFDEVSNVRVGKYIALQVTAKDAAAARRRVSAMCEALLANTVIEHYEFTLNEENG